MMPATHMAAVQRYSAFTRDPQGGNPAGVVLDAHGWSDEDMQGVAAKVGYSETAFVTGEDRDGVHVRYFSPAAEVPFCGHATIALAVALGERFGAAPRVLLTRSGAVPVETETDAQGAVVASLTSVTPRVSELADADLDTLLDLLGWSRSDLSPDLPPRVSYAGASHPILVAAHRERLDVLDYPYDRIKPFMDEHGWTTIDLVWPLGRDNEHIVRNVFPAGPVREDPATGAAAAAYGAYLRHLRAIEPPVRLVLRQGQAMGRPSTIYVDVPPGTSGITVSGHAVSLPHL